MDEGPVWVSVIRHAATLSCLMSTSPYVRSPFCFNGLTREGDTDFRAGADDTDSILSLLSYINLWLFAKLEIV